MKILITTDAYDAMINGVAISVKTLYTALTESGNEVRILTLSQTHQSYKNGDVYYIGSVPIKIYPDARATLSFHNNLLDEIVEWKPDIIHSQCEFFTFIFARKLSRILDIPIVHTYHTLYEYYTHYFCPSKTLGKKIVAVGSKFICKRTDAVIAPTAKTADILENYGVDTPMSVIPTGLSLEKFKETPDSVSSASLRAKLGIPEDVPVLLTLGRVAREKNIDFFLKQMAAPEMRKTQAHLVIVGDGPDRERLECMVHNLHLKEAVHFTGMVKPDEVAAYYRIGDVFVSASQSETQGLTYIEAMACGLPLLCRQDQCLSAVLVSGKNGYAFESEDDFFENFSQVFQSKEHLKQLSSNAYQTAYYFSKEMFARRAIQLYKDIMIERGAKEKCIRFACIPKQIWQKGTGF